MTEADDILISVLGAWNGWNTAEVRLRSLTGLHWRQPDHAPQPLIHGYVLCTDIVSGQIPHDCTGCGVAHRLMVCVLKRHNAASAFADLTFRIAAAAPASPGRRTSEPVNP